MSSLRRAVIVSALGLGIALASIAPAARAGSEGWVPAGAETIETILPTLAKGQLLVVEVSAQWCSPCHQLKNEVLDTALGASALEADRALTVDFESAYGGEVKRKYGVLNLPTTFVLDGEGVEIGRVEGYPGRHEWCEALRDAKAGRHGLSALEARAKAAPRDLAVQIELAQARLVRGDEARALAELDRIITRAGPTDPAAQALAAHAARIKGRWLLRVKEDGPGAVTHFTAMMERFAGTPHASHFLYWAACAYHAIRADATAVALFDAWVAEAPGDPTPLVMQADFMVHFGLPLDAAERVVRRALELAPKTAELHYLLARVRLKRDDPAGARAAIDVAIAAEPETAMYKNFLRRLPADSTGAAAP